MPIAYPGLNVSELFVEFFRLCTRIKNPEVGRGINPATRYPLPVADIARHFIVQQFLREIRLAPAPIDQQMFAQETRSDHAYAIVHGAGCIELAHTGVDDGITGGAFAPALEFRLIVAPLDSIVLRLEAALWRMREMPENLTEELAPDQFIAENIAMRECMLEYLPDTDCAKAQVRPQQRCGG